MEREQRKPWSMFKGDAPVMKSNKAVASWHRIGWSQRTFHTTEARGEAKQQHQQQQQQKAHVTLQHDLRPVVAHTHSCTYMHSQKQCHTHKTTLLKSWVPGHDGVPAAALNTEGLCDEMNMRLLNIDQTLLGLLAANQPSEQQLLAGGSEAVRQQLATSLDKQVAFATACLLDWCGATPVGSSEQVLQQLLAGKQQQ